MTTTYHTPHVFGAPLTAEEINRPLSELDLAIDTVVLAGSGTTTTLTATANAGQPSLVVADSSGFAVGDSVWIGDPGGTNEVGTVLSVPSGTQITLTANLTNTYASGKAVSKSPAELVAARGGAATLATRLSWLQGGVFNVKAYGATGDGTTNDRAALQAAFDACHAAGGGVVFIPAGTYVFDDVAGVGLELPYPATILGAGQGSTKLSYTGANGTLVRFKDYATAEQRLWMRIEGFELANDGAATAVTGIDLKGLNRSVVRRILLSGMTGASSIGLLVDGSYGSSIGAWWNVFERIDTAFVGTGIKFTGVLSAGQANENVVRDCTIVGHSVAGVHVDIGDNVVVERCDLTSAQGGTGVILSHLTGVVRSCRFESCQTGVWVKSGTGTLDRNRVEDCLFVGNGSTTDYGIRIDSGGTNTKVDHCRFSGTHNIAQILDDSTGTNSTTIGRQSFPIVFTQTNVAAGQTSVALTPAGADASNQLVYVGRAYRIRGVTLRLSAAISGGTLTVKPTIGGTESSTLAAVLSASVTAGDWQGLGLDEDVGGNGVGCKVTTPAGFTPTTGDLTVIVWVEFKD